MQLPTGSAVQHSMAQAAAADRRDIPALVQRLRGGGSRVVQLQAANRLMDMFVRSAAELFLPRAAEQDAFAAAGGIEAALQVSQSGSSALRTVALELLKLACVENARCAEAVVAAGGIATLLRMLQPSSLAAGEPWGYHW